MKISYRVLAQLIDLMNEMQKDTLVQFFDEKTNEIYELQLDIGNFDDLSNFSPCFRKSKEENLILTNVNQIADLINL